MIINYDEGAYNNWTAIHFPDGVQHTVLVQANHAQNRQIYIRPLDADNVPVLGVDKSVYQSVITGDVSGVSVDLRNLPVISNWPPGSGTASGTPECDTLSSGYYFYPSGSAVTSAPFNGASIGEDYILGTLRVGGVLIVGRQSYTYDAGPPELCIADSNAPANPAFITGETVSFSDP